jgi:PAS domain S-box-containing protein
VRPALTADDRFFRHIVNSMRNGVIAFRRNGVLALMNDEAYRIFGLSPKRAISGVPSRKCFATGLTSSASS